MPHVDFPELTLSGLEENYETLRYYLNGFLEMPKIAVFCLKNSKATTVTCDLCVTQMSYV